MHVRSDASGRRSRRTRGPTSNSSRATARTWPNKPPEGDTGDTMFLHRHARARREGDRCGAASSARSCGTALAANAHAQAEAVDAAARRLPPNGRVQDRERARRISASIERRRKAAGPEAQSSERLIVTVQAAQEATLNGGHDESMLLLLEAVEATALQGLRGARRSFTPQQSSRLLQDRSMSTR